MPPKPAAAPTTRMPTRAGNNKIHPGVVDCTNSEGEIVMPEVKTKRKRGPPKPKLTAEERTAQREAEKAAKAAKTMVSVKKIAKLEANMATKADQDLVTPVRAAVNPNVQREDSYIAPDPEDTYDLSDKELRNELFGTTSPKTKKKKASCIRDVIAAVHEKDSDSESNKSMDMRGIQYSSTPLTTKSKSKSLVPPPDQQDVPMDVDDDIEEPPAKPRPRPRAIWKPEREQTIEEEAAQDVPMVVDARPQAVKPNRGVESLFSDGFEVPAPKSVRIARKKVVSSESEVEVGEIQTKPTVKKGKPVVVVNGSENAGKQIRSRGSVKAIAESKMGLVFDGSKVDQKTGARYVHPLNNTTTMLTLDRMTLFFWDLSQSYRHHDTAEISGWRDTLDFAGKKKTGSNASTPSLTSGTSRRTAGSLPSTSSRSSQTNRVKVQTNEVIPDSEDEAGPISDRDETDDVHMEQDFLGVGQSSKDHAGRPAIRKVSVKIEESSRKALSDGKKTTSRITLEDLPQEMTRDSNFALIMSYFIRYMASSKDPWTATRSAAATALQAIVETINPSTDLVIEPTDYAPKLALQRLADSWRTIVGSAGLAALSAFFDSQKRYRDSDSQRKEFALRMYENKRFMYLVADSDDPENFRGIFQGVFVIQAFAAHLNIVSGTRDLATLYSVDADMSVVASPRAGLALAATSVMRAVILYASGTVNLASIKEAESRGKNAKVKYPDTKILPFTSRDKKMGRTWTSSFSATGWSDSTRKLLAACRDNVSDEQMALVIRDAKQYAKLSRSKARESNSDQDPDDSILNMASGKAEDDDDH